MSQPILPRVPFQVKAIYSWSGEQKGMSLFFLHQPIIVSNTSSRGSWFYRR